MGEPPTAGMRRNERKHHRCLWRSNHRRHHDHLGTHRRQDHHRGRDPRRDALLPLDRRTPREALRGDAPVPQVHPIRAAHRPACRERSQTRQPLLRIRTTREPIARQLPQRPNAGSGDGEKAVGASRKLLAATRVEITLPHLTVWSMRHLRPSCGNL